MSAYGPFHHFFGENLLKLHRSDDVHNTHKRFTFLLLPNLAKLSSVSCKDMAVNRIGLKKNKTKKNPEITAANRVTWFKVTDMRFPLRL